MEEHRPLDPDGYHGGHNDAPEFDDDDDDENRHPQQLGGGGNPSAFRPPPPHPTTRPSPPAPSSSSSSSSRTDHPSSSHQGFDQGDAAASNKRKRMVLLLLMTFVVALLGATFGKRSVMSAEADLDLGYTVGRDDHGGGGDGEADGRDGGTTNAIVDDDPPPDANHDGYIPKNAVNPFYVLPGTEDAVPLSAAMGRPYVPITNHFQTKDPSSPYSKTWGYFDFIDPDPKWEGRVRPMPSNIDAVPNRDVTNADFPDGSWQRDGEYMKLFLSKAKVLVNRTLEAVYAEYGVGMLPNGDPLSDEKMVERELFAPYFPMSEQTFEGITRRVIHHVMTGDTMKLVLGGHSAAAGHGAGHNQSYIIEAGHVLEPVFAHLGVEFRSYNFAQGGMGTFQQSMAGMDLRGKDADILLWDSSMTEKDGSLANFFFRQGLISGHRSPILFQIPKGPMQVFHDVAGVAFLEYDEGWVPVTDNDEQVKSVPWAAQWLSCSRTATTDCKAHEYTAGCWVEREDYTPTTPQNALVGGQAGWHPGNRIHKRRGRMIAIAILRSLASALERWEALGHESGYPISEKHWHVTEYYENIREKATKIPGCFGDVWPIGKKRSLEEIDEGEAGGDVIDDDGRKLDGVDFWPGRICDIPLHGRSLWGPRYDPMASSLLSIMRPNVFGDVDPAMKTNTYMAGPVYLPPDRPAPWTVPPDVSEPFAPFIAAARRLIVNEDEGDRRLLRSVQSKDEHQVHHRSATRALNVSVDGDAITPGLGIQVNWGLPGVCDGSSHHWCDKTAASSCLMAGSQDNRGSLCFNGFSGWVVFDLKSVKHGFIGARMEAWSGGGADAITAGWTEVNNGGRGNYDKRGRERRLHEEHQERNRREYIERMKREIEDDILAEGDPTRRRLGGGQSCGLHGDYLFEFAINGKVMGSWNMAQFCEHYTRLAYNFDVIKFMDDQSQTGDIEFAMRMAPVDGKRGPAMCITHLYWA